MKTRSDFINTRRGFTLIELLVIVAVIAVMVALVIPVMASASLISQRTVCMNQLRQQGQAITVFANAHSQTLPSNAGFGYWAWDMAGSVQTSLTNAGTSKYTWYDPGVEPRFSAADFDTLWSFLSFTGGGGLIGYCQTFAGSASFADNGVWKFSTNLNTKLNQTTVSDGGATYPIHPSSRPLMACANMQTQGTSTSPAVQSTYDWLHILGGYFKEHLSAHMLNPSQGLPAGGNEGMLDGHVAWVPFAQMLPRCGGSGDPYFYY